MSYTADVSAYLCLGANLGDTEASLRAAVAALDRLPGLHVGKCSPVYVTEPQGRKDQPWFANQVIELVCSAGQDPWLLLRDILTLEAELGRERYPDMPRDAPRNIDLDLLLLGNTICNSPELVLPHPRLTKRAFVLVPLLDIAPDLVLPDGRQAGMVLRELAYCVQDGCIYQR